MVKGTSQVFIAGPAVVEAGMRESVDKEELGGWQLCARAGTVDLVADSEADAFALTRRVLSYLPRSVWHLPERGPVDDDPQRRDDWLRDAVPRSRRAPYDVRRVLDAVFDRGSVLELGRRYAPATVTALARLDGWPVAVLASDPRVYGGGLTADGSDKMTRFVDLADTFHLPVVHLVDQPGFVIGTGAGEGGHHPPWQPRAGRGVPVERAVGERARPAGVRRRGRRAPAAPPAHLPDRVAVR